MKKLPVLTITEEVSGALQWIHGLAMVNVAMAEMALESMSKAERCTEHGRLIKEAHDGMLRDVQLLDQALSEAFETAYLENGSGATEENKAYVATMMKKFSTTKV